MLFAELLSEDGNLTAVGIDDLVNDTDKGGFASSVRSEQAKNGLLRNGDAYLIERYVIGVALGNVVCN